MVNQQKGSIPQVLVDSDASCHMTCFPQYMLHDFVHAPSMAYTAKKDSVVHSPGHGGLHVKGLVCCNDGTQLELLFKNTVCVPTFSNTLVAVNKLTERGSMTFARKKCTFRFGGHTIVIPVNVDGLYTLQFEVIPPPTKRYSKTCPFSKLVYILRD
jgi:hypothetical protein